ncbi:MAG TPA: hypothetical protein PKA02_03820 [Candidatus Saccharibacteria bacterium]|nr:hypothetical protein [Candidatus Saccharibacteria bacterium]
MSVVFAGESQELGQASFVAAPTSFDFARDDDMRLTNPDLAVRVKRMGEKSLLLITDQFAAVDEAGLVGSFVDVVEFGYGREENTHGVYFGQLILASDGDYERPELVAIKPYDQDRRGAVHELLMNYHLNSKDAENPHNRAFQPLGFFRDADGEYAFITRYEHAVTSYDSILWANPEQEPGALTPERILKAVRGSAYGIGHIHGLRVAHGDAQAKNLGNDSRQPRFLDLEQARIFATREDGSIDEALARTAVDKDIKTFLESCFREPPNAEPIAEVIMDSPKSIGRLYQEGVKRTRSLGSRAMLPGNVIPTVDDITSMVDRVVTAELEAIDQAG